VRLVSDTKQTRVCSKRFILDACILMDIVVSVSLLLGFMPTNRSPWTMFMLLGYDAFDVMLNCPLDDTALWTLGK
jgi:hypothetical protein